MILVDTSVWVDYLRGNCPQLAKFLEKNQVVMNPLIIGELACGNLKNRAKLLSLWKSLETTPTATHDENLFFIEDNRLMGKGIGYIDIQLLATTKLSPGLKLWTHDKRLANIAEQMGCKFDENFSSEL